MTDLTVPGFISKLKLKQLKTAAFLLGLPMTGRSKADIGKTLSRSLQKYPYHNEFSKVLSIDMGIRNLGICVLKAPHLAKAGCRASGAISPLTVSAWDRVSVLEHLRMNETIDPGDSASADGGRRLLSRVRDRTSKELIGADLTPANLAEAAYKLISSLIVHHQPSVILIERQRFRTAGGASVPEWTLRVNALEQAFWACLRTLMAQYTRSDTANVSQLAEAVRGIEAVREVSPAKVAKFWCSSIPTELRDEIGSEKSVLFNNAAAGISKIKKSDKIAVAQGWVDHWKVGGKTDPIVRLDFRGDAIATANAFQSTPGKRKPGKRKGEHGLEEREESIGKLDDLADCLLQGVAWVKWEENRRKFADMAEKGEKA